MLYDTTAERGENRTDLIDLDALASARWYPSKPVRCSDPDCGCKSASNGPQAPQTPQTNRLTAQSASEADVGCVVGPEVADPTDEPCALVESLRDGAYDPAADWQLYAGDPPPEHEMPLGWEPGQPIDAAQARQRLRDRLRPSDYAKAATGELLSCPVPTAAELASAESIAGFIEKKLGQLRQVFVPRNTTPRWSGREQRMEYRPMAAKTAARRVAGAAQFAFWLGVEHADNDNALALDDAGVRLKALSTNFQDNREMAQQVFREFQTALFDLGCDLAGLHDHSVLRGPDGCWFVMRREYGAFATPRIALSPLTKAGVGATEWSAWFAWGRENSLVNYTETYTSTGAHISDVDKKQSYRALPSVLRRFEVTGIKTPVPLAHLMLMCPEAWNDNG